MYSKSIIGVMIAALFLSMGSTSLSAQTFVALLEKLDSIEKKLESLESSTRKEIKNVESRVQSQIQQINSTSVDPVQAPAVEDSTIALLEEKLNSLSQDIQTIRMGSTEQASNGRSEEVVALANDLRGLVSELRGTIAGSPQFQPTEFTEQPQDAVLTPLEITGFGDFSYSAHRGQDGEESFSLGQAEVDIETTFREKIVMTAALAYEPADGTFGLGQLTFDFHLFGDEADHFKQAPGIDYSGLIIGQFDVPFGLDWMVYPSIDRKMVTGPMVVANTHDYWNDYGAQFYIGNKWFNAVAYGLNGFGYGEVEMNASAGGRIGFKPHRILEIGTSYAGFFNADNRLDMSLTGYDVQLSIGNIQLKGEFITHKYQIAGNEGSVTNNGYYLQGIYDFGPCFTFGRYGSFSPYQSVQKDITRISSGGGVVLMEGVEFRVEHQFNSTGSDQTYLQAVVAF